MIEAFFNPVGREILKSAGAGDGTMGATMRINGKKFPDLNGVRVALIGTGGNASLCRKELYRLYHHFSGTVIADLGDLRHDGSAGHLSAGLRECIIALREMDIIPVVIGDDHDFSDAVMKAIPYRQTDYALVSPYLAYQPGTLAWKLHQKKRLFRVSTLATQQYLNSPASVQYGYDVFSETLRLGELSANVTLAEPLLRQSDIFEFDLRAIRRGEFSAATEALPNGMQNREACAICRYAGLSDTCVLYLLNHFDLKQGNGADAMQAAQMIWYLIDGIDNRFNDVPRLNDRNFTVYKCHSHNGDDMVFLFSEISGRWWMQVPSEGKKRTAPKFIGCTENDHNLAEQGEVPEKWYRAMRKNE